MCAGRGGTRDWEACRGLILNSLQCLGGWEASGRGEPVPGGWGGERLEAGVGGPGRRLRCCPRSGGGGHGHRWRGRNAAGSGGRAGWGLTSPKLMRLACFRISVSPSRSFILRYLGTGQGVSWEGASLFPSHSVPARLVPGRHLRPPLFLRCPSRGAGSGFTCFTGGGSCHLSNLRSISSFSS